ncbi:MAG TPA: phosphoesterase [Clostridiaceae bacterium]|nr:phosphoesterase [Clostridiaceae bacterium]
MENKKFPHIFIPRAQFYLWIIFIFLVVIALLEWRVAVPGSLLFIFLIYHYLRTNYLRQKEITRYIENLTFNTDTAAKDTLLNFPMPLVIMELDGTIIWYNSSFRAVFDNADLLERKIGEFASALHPGDFLDNTNENNQGFSKDVVISGRSYTALGNFVKVDEKNNIYKYIVLIYLIDNTELIKLQEKYDEERIVCGVVVIDNYDDLMQSTEETDRPQMLAEIEKKLASWFSFTGGLLKKIERDKYVLIFEHKYLKVLEEKKFDILDSVKEVNLGNHILVTLSIGIGFNGKTLSENFQYAGASLDIALGRGGDQVVIKDGENISFYGGKTREVEKRTKVKARVIAHALRELIDESSSILIMGHVHGDIDSLGASLGIYAIVRGRNKQAHIVMNESNPAIDKMIRKISSSEDHVGIFIGTKEALDMIDKKTLLVVVDTYRPAFTESPALLNHIDRVVVIDHHRRGADFIKNTVLSYTETYASSASELVTEILQYVDDKLKINPIEAEGLYAGIILDTKNFTFKTGVRTFEAAAYLRRQGVDTVSVKQLFQNDIETYINRSNIVKNAELISDSIAISICPPNVKHPQFISAQAADELLTLSGVVAAFVISQENNEVAISGRSLGDINVQVILEKLGGGGHLTEAGAQIKGISVEDAKKELKYAIMDYMESINNE